MSTVQINNVKKSYGKTDILHGVSGNIDDGEFVILVGPSGCGKSTLLRMVAGLESITSGEISIGGRVVNELAPKERDIAMVFQNYALYPQMTVAENMGFSLKLAGLNASDITESVNDASRILGLEHLLDRYPRQLSGGQRQRVAMGRAIVRNPKVFLFDEPLSNLDAKLRVQMRTEIKELQKRLGTTTIYVTHDQIEAMTMADKIIVMQGGVIEQIGSPLELYDHPNNIFVAGFIGSPAMNFINCKVSDNHTVLFEHGLDLALDRDLAPLQHHQLVLGIRPEHIMLEDNPEAGLAVQVTSVEQTGSETHVGVKFGNSDLICMFKFRVLVNVGDYIHISFQQNGIHLFDSETRIRI